MTRLAEITCENCGLSVVRRGGVWVHEADDGSGLGPRCWPGKDFLAFPEMDDVTHEHECRRCGSPIECKLLGCDETGPTDLPVWEGDNVGCECEGAP